MIYKSFLPGPALREFVRNYTIVQFQFDPNKPLPLKYRAPKSEQKIVFYLKDLPEIQSNATATVQTPSLVTVFSHQTDRTIIRIPASFSAFIICLRPGVLYRLTHLPMKELLHGIWDAEVLLGTGFKTLSEQMATAKTLAAMISVVEQFLIKRCSQLPMRHVVDTIAQDLLDDPCLFSLEQIAKKACLCTRQFSRIFSERIGISPKLFSRMSRFNQAYQYKIVHPDVSWSGIAQELSYTDYHHLEKEFKAFTTLTPQHWTETHLAAPEMIYKLR